MFGQKSSGGSFGFGSNIPVFGTSNDKDRPNAFGNPGFGSLTSGQGIPGSGASQPLGFSTSTGTAVFGSSAGFGQMNPSFGSESQMDNPGFPTLPRMTSGSPFGMATSSSTIFGNAAPPTFGSPSTSSTTPTFGSLKSTTPAFAQFDQGSFASKTTAFGGVQFQGFGTVTTTANNETSMFTNNSSNVFADNTASSISFPPSTESSFGSTSMPENPNTFALSATSGPAFGGAGSVTFKSPGTSGVFTGMPSSSVFGTNVGHFGTGVGSSAFGSSVFAATTAQSSGIFSSMPSSESDHNSKSVMSAESIMSTSVLGCISSTGQPVSSSLPANTSVQSVFQSTAPTSTSSRLGIFGVKTEISSEGFGKSNMESKEGTGKSKPITGSISSTPKIKMSSDQKESPPVRALFGKTTESEKELPEYDGKKVSKSGLFLAAISDIASKRENKKPDKPKIHISRLEDKGSGSKETIQRKIESSSIGHRITRRRSTQEGIQKKISIVVRGITPSCNNKEFLKSYFEKFGTVKRIFVNPAKESATVHFTSHNAAQAAMQSTKYLKPDTPRVQIFWSSYTPRKESVSSTSTSAEKSELQDELESMQGTSDLYEGEMNILKRTEDGAATENSEDKRSKWKLGVKPGLRSKIHDVKERSSTSRLKPLKKPVKSTAVKSETTDKSKKGTDHVSLKALSNSVAQTAAERVEILENRDKILRMALESKKQIYLATTEAIIGTCPDMCPEKERYLREVRRHLSIYEIVQGTDMPGQNPKCDHMRAVKEYSRSSADQEMPLPHELRPPAVLSMTMDYLMNNIVEAGGDGKWADWYEYLWSRTRSLRKDITQQDLCDPTSVEVIEKNCRFHIYCAERLCEEDMSTFDEKINNENLTKCLQTLKQMYYDLEKSGTFCPNEAEFRAYIVLMNLNSGDTLREVQQLREEVRESEPVMFATKVYSALNCNNYIKFFKLVQMAPFLYACILHRYFNQVRSCALRTMLRAYSWRGQSTQYPLSDMIHLLQFENDNDAVMFCHHHGLTVEDDKVVMDRKSFIEPDTAMEPRRARNLIESKQQGLVGEVVNGGPLPPTQLPQPHSSFDENGRFIPIDIAIASEEKHAEDTLAAEAEQPDQQNDSTVVTEEPQSIQSTSHDSKVQRVTQEEVVQPVYSNEAIKEVAKLLFIDVINEHVTSISQSMMRDITVYLGSAVWIYEEMQRDVTSTMFRQVAETALDECEKEKRELIARHKAELSALKAKAMNVIVEEMVASFVHQESEALAEAEYREVEKQLGAESEARVSEDITEELVDRTVQEEVCLVAETVFATDVVERLQEIEESAEATKLLVTARFLEKWRKRYAASQQLKSSILNFPSVPSMKPLAEQINTLIPESQGIINGSLHLGVNAYATLDSAAEVAHKEAVLNGHILLYRRWKERRHRHTWSALCLGSILYSKLRCRLYDLNRKHLADEAIYWKLILSLPDVGPNSSLDDDYAQRTITWCDWLRAKFTKGTVPSADPESKTELLSLYTTHTDNSGKLGVCIRLVKGFPDEDDEEMTLDRSCLLGTSAVIFYVGEADPDHEECYVAEVQSRLQHLLENLPKCCPVPLIIMCPAGSPITEHNLNLELFLQEDMISGYKFVTAGEDVDDPEHHKNLIDSLLWTTNQYPKPPQLASSSLLEVVEDTISCHYFNLVYQTLGRGHHKTDPYQLPELLVNYYNQVISHIAEIVSDSTLQDLSWPIAEFSKEERLPAADWNTPEQLAFLRQTVLSLQLPEYDRTSEEDSNLEWTAVMDQIWAYVAAVAEDGDSSIMLFSKVNCMLNKLEQRFGLATRTCLCLVDWQVLYANIPWPDIIQACYEHKLRQTSWTNPAVEDEMSYLMAHYYASKLKDCTPSKEWLQLMRDASQITNIPKQETRPSSVKRRLSDGVCSKHNRLKIVRVDATASAVDLAVPKKVLLETESSAHTLKVLIANEKNSNERFEEFLQKSLLDDSFTDWDINRSSGSPNISVSLKRKSLADVQAENTPSLSLDDSNNSFANHGTVSDNIKNLNSVLKSQKQADFIFEMRLKSFLTD